MNTERHPAGRGCWGGATAILLIAGAVTATGLAIGHTALTQDNPTVPANAPAAVVRTLAPTITATPTVAPPVATTAPIAPRALMAAPTTTTEDPTVPENPPATDANGVRVAPSNPNANQPPSAKDYGQAGLDANGNPVGPPPQTPPGGVAPQGQPPTG